jgi:hypothetical protein
MIELAANDDAASNRVVERYMINNFADSQSSLWLNRKEGERRSE